MPRRGCSRGEKFHLENGALTLRIPNDVKRELDCAAWQLRCSLSELARKLLTPESIRELQERELAGVSAGDDAMELRHVNDINGLEGTHG